MPATINATLLNGMVEAENVSVKLFYIADHIDTVMIGEKIFEKLGANELIDCDLTFVVPEKIEFLEFFANVDSENDIIEFCEENNFVMAVQPILGPDWIMDVKNYPNPVSDYTQFHYTLPRPVSEMRIEIYDSQGKKVDEIRNCPIGYGQHSIEWTPYGIVKGAYIYYIIGVNEQGEPVKYMNKLLIGTK